MKFIAFLSLALPLSFLISLMARAEVAAERGHRTVSFLEIGKAWHATISEHPQDDGNLRLVIEGAGGQKVQSDTLVGALEQNESDVASYHVSLEPGAAGSVVVSSLKDWGSLNYSYRYTIAPNAGGYVVAAFDYSLKRPKKALKCSLDLLKGQAMVDGRAHKFSAPTTSLAKADGLELEQICEDLAAVN